MASRNISPSSSTSSTSSTALSSSASSAKSSSTRTSIHTPLKPASVQDLKARFDPSKMTNTRGSTGASSSDHASSPMADRREVQRSSFGKGSSAVGNVKSTANITLSSVNSSLQSACQRKVGSETSSASSTLSSSTSAAKTSLALTTPRPFTPSSSSSSSSSSAKTSASSSITSSTTKVASKWEPKTDVNAKSARSANTTAKGSSNGSSSIDEVREMFEKGKESRIELPVTHVTTSRSETKKDNKFSRNAQADNKARGGDGKLKKPGGFQPRTIGQKVNEAKSMFTDSTANNSKASPKTSPRSEKPQSDTASPPVQRTKRLVAREITIERLDSGVNVTSYKDTGIATTEALTKPSNTTTNLSDVGNKVKEIKVQRMPPSDTSKEDLPFQQIKLRNAKAQIEKQASSDALKSASSELKPGKIDSDPRRLSRKISSERFERLMFDFERGVPTEAAPRRGSEHSDHLELQQKARELANTEKSETSIIAKKNKEESIFKEGLKVSDFVKQVNKMNPEVAEPPKWKMQQKTNRSQTSSAASSDIGGDNFYQGIPGEEEEIEAHEGDMEEDDDDDIYEKVNLQVLVRDKSEQNGGSSPKPPSRRLGVYRRQKPKGHKKNELKAQSKAQSIEDEEDEEVIHSDGEGGWDIQEEDSSSGTDYEDVGQGEAEEEEDEIEDDLYEDLETFAKPANPSSKGNTLTHKLKKIFVNKKKKAKSAPDLAASTGTDSEGDLIDDVPDEADGDLAETLSRTSSERSSGRLTRDDLTTSSISTTTSTTTAASASDEGLVSATTSASTASQPPAGQSTPAGMASNLNAQPPPPPLPPRATKSLNLLPENSPPLPPRNPSLTHKSTLGVPALDIVVPVSPTNKSGGSYRSGDKKKDRFSYGANSQEGSDSGISSCKLEYIDYEPASAQTLDRIEKRKSTGSNRPVSAASSGSSSNSSYMYPDMTALSDLHGGDNGENESLYVDLEDEQIYGKTSDIYVSKFESEPLYQWYSKDKMMQGIRVQASSASGDLSDEEYLELEKDNGDSVYEDMERLLDKNLASSTYSSRSSLDGDKKNVNDKQKPQRRSIIEDVFNKGGTLHRALWCQMPEVIKSGLLEKISDQEKKIQEAMFEIMTSEASYLKSLNILISVFLMAPEFSGNMSDRCVITRRDRTTLFSNIGSIRDISAKFLADLEARWNESCYMNDVCDIIVKHASNNFEPYVRYCCNQIFQDRALTSLKQNSEFSEAVKRLEMRPECQFLPLASFLLLPMQRITRLPLLVDAICHRLEAGSAQHTSARKAFESLTKVAKRCDEAAKKMQQTEQMYHLNQNLEFKIKEIPLVSASRFLVKQGELTLLKGDSGTVRKPLSKLLGSNKEHIYLYLFNDMVLVTKKKGSIYQVRDHCQRNSLHAEAVDNADKSRHIAPGHATGASNLMLLAMLANHENKQVELVISCKSESERTRWIDAIMPTQSNSETERIYDFWDCPQHQCVIKYLAQQPDELTLEEADVVNVTRKMADGWYEGERIRDGEKGWFPASHTEEINNSHVRARNLRLRYRLMIASENLQAEREKR